MWKERERGERDVGLGMKRFEFEHGKVACFHTPPIKPPPRQPEHLFFLSQFCIVVEQDFPITHKIK
jgi:hypothetical protein